MTLSTLDKYNHLQLVLIREGNGGRGGSYVKTGSRPRVYSRADSTIRRKSAGRWYLQKLLNSDVNILLLDEPTTKGVDVGAKAQIYSIMSDLAAQGYAIILVSSEMPEVMSMADRIGVMHEGIWRQFLMHLM